MCTVLWPRDPARRTTSEDEEHPRLVTKKGFPIMQGGMDRVIEIHDEIDKRDQDCHNMYIYNDWTGYGVTEVMKNMVRVSHFPFILHFADSSS
jgi:hypothetical protein